MYDVTFSPFDIFISAGCDCLPLLPFFFPPFPLPVQTRQSTALMSQNLLWLVPRDSDMLKVLY